jgi:hypothetical protein
LKGIAIWVLGFLTLLSAANVVNAVIMWFNLGPEGTFTPYPLGSVIATFPVYAYFLISVLITVAFLGVTTHMAVGELSNTEQIKAITERMTRFESGQLSQQKTLDGVKAKMFLVDESLERTRKELSNGLTEQGNDVKQSVEKGHQTQQKMLDGVQGRVFLLDESLKGVKKELNDQTDVMKNVNANLVDKVGPQLAEIRETSTKQLKEMESALEKIQQGDKKTASTVAKQADEIAEIRLKLEKLEAELIKPKPLLTSQSSVEDVKGIGPGKGTELREIGITNAGELIMADTKLVADRMGSSEKTVEKLQGRAQLAMTPGLKEKDLFLLEELDITDRKSLAEQDPIDLSKKINAVFKVNVAKGKVSEGDRPTIEEIASWVKFVRH